MCHDRPIGAQRQRPRMLAHRRAGMAVVGMLGIAASACGSHPKAPLPSTTTNKPATSGGPGGLTWAVPAKGARFVATSSTTLFTANRGLVHAYSLANGHLFWIAKLNGFLPTTAASFADGMLLAGEGGKGAKALFVSPAGKVSWQTRLQGQPESISAYGSQAAVLTRLAGGGYQVHIVNDTGPVSTADAPASVGSGALMAASASGIYISAKTSTGPGLALKSSSTSGLWMTIPYPAPRGGRACRAVSLFAAGSRVVQSIRCQGSGGRGIFQTYATDGAGLLLNTISAEALGTAGGLILAAGPSGLAGFYPQGSPAWATKTTGGALVAGLGTVAVVALGAHDIQAISTAKGSTAWRRALPAPLVSPAGKSGWSRVQPFRASADPGGFAMILKDSGGHHWICQFAA